MIQQPGGDMTQLMTQSTLQLVTVINHLAAQLHSSCVPEQFEALLMAQLLCMSSVRGPADM